MEDLNTVALAGRLTKDPEVRAVGDTSVCALRLAVTKSVKRDGRWEDAPCYFDVSVWGNQGENAARYLSRGSFVMVRGRLDWREWETPEGGKRQAVSVVAERVHFGPKGDGGGESSGGFTPRQEAAPAQAPEDDIPF